MKDKSPSEKYETLIKLVRPNEFQQKQLGEVLTPLTLVEEMVAQIDIYCPQVWSNPNARWLDNSVGLGAFMVVIYAKLMIGLRTNIPDEQKRRSHILTEMLYVCDICPFNISCYKMIMGYKKDYNKKNIICADSLAEESFKGYKFDMVIGNPPYQPPTNGQFGGSSLWPLFVEKAVSVLKNKGFLLYVHPAIWRKPEHKTKDLLFSRQIHYLEIHNIKQGIKTFKCGTRYDWYLLENTIPYKKSTVVFEDKTKYDISISKKLAFIPNFGWNVLRKISKYKDEPVKAERNYACGSGRPHVSETRICNIPSVIPRTPLS